MSRISIEGLQKIFDDDGNQIVAVNDLDLEIADGEFLTLVGPSGCGKSTTLRCLAGLETVSGGTIRLDGTDVTDRKPMDRGMAMVFQSYALYPHMTARQNMGFGLKMTTDLTSDEIDQRVRDAAGMMGIEELLEKKPTELSGGQQQRVALGRAIVRDPEVFLMDEPLSNLDAKLRTQMRTELQALQQRLDVTTIYVTHDQVEAMTMSDRIAILNDGQLQQVGTPLECYYRPNNRFVAGFIGSPSMNFLDVSIEDGTIRNEHLSFDVTEKFRQELPGGGAQLTLGIRPEDIRIDVDDAENSIDATVDVVEPMGDTTYVYLDVNGHSLTASITRSVLYDKGTTVQLTFPEDTLHLFDRETGETLRQRETTEAEIDLAVLGS